MMLLYNPLKGGRCQVGVGLLSPRRQDERTWPQSVPGKFRLDVMEDFFTERVMGCPGRWRVKVFKKTMDVALKAMV